MTKKINNIVFYKFKDNYGVHIQTCVFFEDQTVQSISVEEGELAVEALQQQEKIADCEQLINKKIHLITGAELEQNFQEFKKVDKKAVKKEKQGFLKKFFSKFKKKKSSHIKNKKGKFVKLCQKVRNSKLLVPAVAIVSFFENKIAQIKAIPSKMSAKVNKIKSKKRQKDMSDDLQYRPEPEEFNENPEFEKNKVMEEEEIIDSIPVNNTTDKRKKSKIDKTLYTINKNIADQIVELMAKKPTSQKSATSHQFKK